MAAVTVAQTVAALVKVSGDAQAGTVGSALPSPLVVLANDANGNPVSTPITFDYPFEPASTGIVTGSLDDPEAVPPKDHTRTSRRVSWIRLADGLPEFREGRDAG